MKFGLLFTLQDPPDGANLPRLYRQVLAQAECAETMGFDAFFVPEHHQMADGYLPQPLTFAAALAACTQRAEIGTGILQLPLYHPLHVAEQCAVIDNLCNGRFILGAGLGLVEKEFGQFDISLSDAVSRFEETITILKSAWKGRHFSHHGRHFHIDDVDVTPRPVRSPPVWVGAMSERALRRAGRIGDGWISDPLHNFDVMRAWRSMYQTAAEEMVNPRRTVAIVRAAWVAENRKEVEKVWWPHVRDFHLFYLKLGFFSSGRFNAKWEPWVKDACEVDWTFDRLAPERLICGDPEEVVVDLRRYEEEIGADYMIFILQHPTGPSQEETLRCIKLFGEEVLPRFGS